MEELNISSQDRETRNEILDHCHVANDSVKREEKRDTNVSESVSTFHIYFYQYMI